MQKTLRLVLFLFASPFVLGAQIRVNNRCSRTIWISRLTNNANPSTASTQRLPSNTYHVYNIPNSGWGGRIWPKTGCNRQGQGCATGQSIPPCGSQGCTPPAETKVEFFFPSTNDRSRPVFYDISLVDGYSLPAEIIPSQISGSCTRTNCRLSLRSCPRNEASAGDLRMTNQNGQTIACMAPCKKWNWPAPLGLGNSERSGMGLDFCCPTPPVSVGQCRRGAVVQSQYVNLIHRDCPSAYSYAYDDEGGLHNCPNPTDFVVNFC